ncbi:TraG/TraD family protein [Fusobacterium gonidiaformans 3-1-5R]|uniref:TraG/TraD family protein n=3 Tax=Fusobacteriaceae TaxID=203492 RepID=E5BI44_9FUSO|nr:TraG/TraD family protein [Fusobacterium gonidiaformans 3-1-5R]
MMKWLVNFRKYSFQKKISIFLILVGFWVGCQVGTQTFAKKVGYHKALGTPLFYYQKTPIYFPFSIFSWMKWEKSAPKALDDAQLNMITVLLISVMSIGIINKKKKKKDYYGSASWATKKEIENMNFFPYLKKEIYEADYHFSQTIALYQEKILRNCNIQTRMQQSEYAKSGVFVGRDAWGRDLIDLSPGHLMMIAKTGGGKGISVVITTLFTWKGSTIVNDVKGDNWLWTAAYRRRLGHKCFRFEATADGVEKVSCHYNPLAEIRKGTLWEYQDARIIAETLVSPDRLKDPFFGPNGVTYLTAVILHVLYTVKRRVANLPDVYNFMSSPQFTEEEKLKQMMTFEHNDTVNRNLFYEIYNDVIILQDGEESPRTHPRVSRVAADMLGRSDKERSGIISTAKTELEVFAIPTVARNTAYSDFRISDLQNYEVPVDLYFVTPINAIDITSTLLKLFLTQILFILTDKIEINSKGENTAYRHRLLLLMDEFTAIGRIDLLNKEVALMRGHGIKGFFIIQDMKQLKATYGENNAFLGNMSTTIYYSTNDVDTAKYIETRLGNKTEKMITRSYGQGGILFRKNLNYSEHYIARPLMTAEEIHSMDENTSIILSAGKRPIKGKIVKWYEEPEFQNRFQRCPAATNRTPSDVIMPISEN